MELNLVLVEPQIPQNTGNIARTCAVTGARLHIIRPMGFVIDDKKLKRAGLDYWDELELFEYKNFDEVKKKYPDGKFFYCTTKAPRTHSGVDFKEVCGLEGEIFLVFGKETKGLPEDLLEKNYENCIRIPMKYNKRSLNLSNSAAASSISYFSTVLSAFL